MRGFGFLSIFCIFIFTAAEAGADTFYPRLLRDGALRITVALGLKQKVFVRDDGATREADVFTERFLACKSCAFRMYESVPGMRVFESKMQIEDREIPVTIRLIYPASGASIEILKTWFIGALGTDEVIVYAGHSRSGNGFPDFGPIYTNAGQVFYRDPYGDWGGLNRGYFARNKFQLFVLNTCNSNKYYREPLREEVRGKRPEDLGLILTQADTAFIDYAGATTALIEGLLNQKDPAGLLDGMESAAKFFHQFQQVTAPLYVRDRF